MVTLVKTSVSIGKAVINIDKTKVTFLLRITKVKHLPMFTLGKQLFTPVEFGFAQVNIGKTEVNISKTKVFISKTEVNISKTEVR